MDDDHDARTIYCGNLYAEKITEELLYELFLQAGPLERVSIPKENGKNRQFGFVTYKHQASVPYAMKIFSGTQLFNRDLRLNNRNANKIGSEQNQQRGQASMDAPPSLSNMPKMHQYQMQNPFSNNALRGNNSNAFAMNPLNNMMPSIQLPQMQLPPNTQLDFQALLGLSAQMLSSANGFGGNSSGNGNNETHKHQSKMMHHHDSRTRNRNNNYERERRRERSRTRSRERNEWIRNRGRDNKSDRNHRGNDRNNRGNDNNRKRNR